MASAAQFIASNINGLTEYTSRITGKVYRLVPEGGGICVQSRSIETTIWTAKLCEALHMIEMLDAQQQ